MSQNRNDPNYLAQLNAFHRWMDTQYLPANARLLWFMLIHLFNVCDWPEWITIDAYRMMPWLGTRDVRTVYRARDALVDAGLLEYRKGCSGCPNRYRMIYFPCKKESGNKSRNDSKNESGNDC